jgi:hypothetical protein
MSKAPAEFLLEEAKSLYKAEAERYGNLYGRIGVLMAVFAIYANALVWFFQKGLGAANTVFVVGLVVLTVVTVGGFGNLMLALSWGEKFTALLGPSFWVKRRDDVRQAAFEALVVEGHAAPTEEEIENRVLVLLRDDLVEDLTRCTERNMNLNERRFGFLHRASRFAGAGFFALLFLVGVHVYVVWREPPKAVVARVQVVGADGVTPVAWTEGGPCVRYSEAASSSYGPAAPQPRAGEAAAPPAPGNQRGVGASQDAAAPAR